MLSLAIGLRVTMGHNVKHWPSYNINSNNFNERIVNNPIFICRFLPRKLDALQDFELMLIFFVFPPKKSRTSNSFKKPKQGGYEQNQIILTQDGFVCGPMTRVDLTPNPFPFIMWWKFVNNKCQKCPFDHP